MKNEPNPHKYPSFLTAEKREALRRHGIAPLTADSEPVEVTEYALRLVELYSRGVLPGSPIDALPEAIHDLQCAKDEREHQGATARLKVKQDAPKNHGAHGAN